MRCIARLRYTRCASGYGASPCVEGSTVKSWKLSFIAVTFLVACGGGASSSAVRSAAAPASTDSAGGAQARTAQTPAAEAPVQSLAKPSVQQAIDDDSVQLRAGEDNEFQLRDADPAQRGRRVSASRLVPTRTEAAIRFFVVDRDSGPIPGIVIALTAPDGEKYFADETDGEGFSEVLVPVGKKYELVFLSLGRREISARVPISDEPNQNIKLTLRYKRREPPPPRTTGLKVVRAAAGFVLQGVQFDSGRATLRPESLRRLDEVVEYMTHRRSAHIEISGHTDNVGNRRRNRALSKKRAEACRAYLMSKGIDKARVRAVGYGDEYPVASNDTEEGRQQNRRIEAAEI